MSILHYIKTKQKFDFDELTSAITKEYAAIKFEQRTSKLCYLWLDSVSTRGVDVSLEGENWIELRNTMLSSEADYHLTNLLADAICTLFEGNLFKENPDFDDENDAPNLEFYSITYPLFEAEYIAQQFLKDVQSLGYMISANKDERAFGINGPKREAHLGHKFFEKIENESWESKADIVLQTLLNVNYQFPDYTYGNVIETGEGSNKIKLKLITNAGDYMIGKYDFVLFSKNEEDTIAISNYILNSILPETWELLDEFTIAAPQISESDFEKLINKAEALNELDDFEAMMRGERKVY